MAFGALSWDTKEIALTTTHGDKQALGVFHFSNSGNTAVTITKVTSSCDCTSAELIKRVYAPGESGEIKAVFTLGDRYGPQEKIIAVTTDDAPADPLPLVLRVTIPQLFTFLPQILLWRGDEEKAAKSATIEAVAGYKFAKIEITSVSPSQTTARIETVEANAKYKLSVLPDSATWAGTSATIFCLATFPDGTTRRFLLHALVR